MGKNVPLELVFVTQLASVLGDAAGQRCSRVYHKGDRHRFLLSMVTVSAIQMFLAFLVIQYGFPATATQLEKKFNGTDIDVCSLNATDPHYPGSDHCFAQGPTTIFKSISMCPVLLLNGVLNIVYYHGEATMYREPLGVMLLVMCALSSTFLVAPMEGWMGMKQSEGSGALGIVFGIVGALLCTLERRPPSADTVEADASPPDDDSSSRKSCVSAAGCLTRVRSLFPTLVPFGLLSFVYGLYFVMMEYYDDKCNVNAWGYNAIDQVLLPLYIYPAIFVSTIFGCFSTTPSQQPRPNINEGETELLDPVAYSGDTQTKHPSFLSVVRLAFKEDLGRYGQGFLVMFLYRLLINGRAISYYFIASEYDLSKAYLVLTLVRVVLSWIMSLLLVLGVPRFIGASENERRKLTDPINLTAKCLGSCCVILSLLFINGNI